jgi:S-layer homology domain
MTVSVNHLFRTSAAMTLGASLVVATPFLFSRPAIAQRTFFNDVSDSYWAKPFIERLVKEGVINGYADGTFKPEQPVTRAQFAMILRSAFSEDPVRKSRIFKDVPAKHPAAAAIAKAYTTGFIPGYSDNTFRPNEKITKAQTLVFLANGLQFSPPSNVAKTLSAYRDADEIPATNQNGIAAATEKGLVVNYPKLTYLNPTDEVTRAEVAATVYQALVSQGKLPPLAATSKSVAYIVNYDPKGQPAASTGTPSGTTTTGTTTTGTTTTTPPVQNDKLIARGTNVSVKFPGGSDVKLIVAPSDTVVTNLEVAQSILDPKGKTLIPAGSQIQGRFQPININGTPGTQYVADKLVIDGKTYSINLASDALAPTPKQAISTGSLNGGLATIGARLLLGRLFGGGIDLGSILGGVLGSGGNAGSALGGLLGSNTSPTSSGVVLIEPSKLMLKLQSDFIVAHQFGDRPLMRNA